MGLLNVINQPQRDQMDDDIPESRGLDGPRNNGNPCGVGGHMAQEGVLGAPADHVETLHGSPCKLDQLLQDDPIFQSEALVHARAGSLGFSLIECREIWFYI